MKVPSARMRSYSDSGQKLLPRTPVVVELSPRADDTSVFRKGKFMPELLCGVLSSLEPMGAVFGYTDFSSCCALLLDYPGWDLFGFRDPQEISSLAASYAAIQSAEHAIPFSAKVFNLPKDEVSNYFVWRQMYLAGDLLRLDGAPTDPDSISEFVVSGPATGPNPWPGSWWRGRACRRVRTSHSGLPGDPLWFWDIDTDTPDFRACRDYINRWVYPPKDNDE